MFEDLSPKEDQFFLNRLLVFTGAIGLVFFLLLLRLYYLQVMHGDHFRKLSEENRISHVRVRAPRGNIYDRFGNVMVTNRPSFSVNVVPENVVDREQTVAMLADQLAIAPGEIEERLGARTSVRAFEPVRIAEDVDRSRVAFLESLRYEYPGVQIEVEPRRSYPFAEMAAHLLGYVGLVSPAELEEHEDYHTGDYIGKAGIEKELDFQLKGRDGYLKIEVDSLGREVAVLAGVEPVPGNDVFLTLDLSIQQIADEVLEDKAGAVVVLDAGTGDVLAVSSRPGIDPNMFSRGLTREEWRGVNGDPRHPLQNRVLQAQYPPGSVFKIVTAAAALQAGVGTGTTFTCRGALRFGGRDYRCWKRGGHGEIALHRAIVESCDVYFYQLGIKLGIDPIARAARSFGLGAPTGLGGGGEASGLVPSTDWKRTARGEAWFPGETLSAAIGQGYDLVTPVQMAVLAAALANGGIVYRPRIIDYSRDSRGAVVKRFERDPGRRVEVAPENLKILRAALGDVVTDRHGTGRSARVEGLEVSGKTGTAQVVRLKRVEAADGGEIPERFRDHAWFICFASGGLRTVAVSVLVEHGGHGGSASAPLARKILTRMKHLGFFQTAAER